VTWTSHRLALRRAATVGFGEVTPPGANATARAACRTSDVVQDPARECAQMAFQLRNTPVSP
jgi:hypothetical protein